MKPIVFIDADELKEIIAKHVRQSLKVVDVNPQNIDIRIDANGEFKYLAVPIEIARSQA